MDSPSDSAKGHMQKALSVGHLYDRVLLIQNADYISKIECLPV